MTHFAQSPDRHLTDEQVFELLDHPDHADAILRLHLADCHDCRTELAGLSNALTDFRAAASSFAAAQMPSPSQRRVIPTVSHGLRRHAFAASLATAAFLLVSLGHFERPAPASAHPANHSIQNADAGTVSDDALLDGIQQDLSTSIPPSLEPLAVPAGSNESSTQN
jgi:hypothetical protein